MRIGLCAAFLTTFFIQASIAASGQLITLSAKNTSLLTLFKVIKKQSGYDFVYSSVLIREALPVTLDVRNTPLKQVLDQCFEHQPFTYNIEERTIIVLKKPALPVPAAQEGVTLLTLHGKVTDDKNQPLPGATIRVGKSKIMTNTDGTGVFVLKDVPADSYLIASFVGYKADTIAVANRTEINFVLHLYEQSLKDAVVSNGYQTLSQERSAGAFAKPDMQVVEDRSTTMNILQRIDGQIPGFTVNSAPLSQNPYLIRGLSTIGVQNNITLYGGTNRNPLYVVDGIPLDDLSTINPQDVADLTVLKDATAASIWGARATNGVIVINTKKGGRNENIRMRFDGFVNFLGKPNLGYTPVLSSPQYIEAIQQMFDPSSNPYATAVSQGGFVGESSVGIDPANQILYNQSNGVITAGRASQQLDSLSALNNHRQIKDLFYRNAYLTNQTLSFSGGSKIHSFYGSLAFTDNVSPRPNEQDNIYKLNLRQDLRFSDRIQAYLITDLTNERQAAAREPAIDYRSAPYQLFRDANRNNLNVDWQGYFSDEFRTQYQSESNINLDYNPLNNVNTGKTNGNSWVDRLTAGLTVRLIKGLRYEGVVGFVNGTNRVTSYDDASGYLVRAQTVAFTVAPATSGGAPTYYLPTTGGNYQVSNTDQQNWTIRNLLIYDNSWKEGLHQLTVLAGQEAQDQLTKTNSTSLYGYNQELQTYTQINYATLINSGLSNPVASTIQTGYPVSYLPTKPYTQTEVESRFSSLFANVGYTYDRRYTLNGSIRSDKSNLFGLDNSAQNKPAWSVGGKWAVSDEHFIKTPDWLNKLDVRATYGISGNSPAPGTSSSYNIFTAGTSSFYSNNTGLVLSTPANSKLTWESTETINLGLDLAVLHNRLSGAIDLYQKRTSNLLGFMPVNPFSGYSSITGNYGSIQNRGIEIGLTSINIRERDFGWTTTLNLAYNKNKITQLNDPTAVTTGDQLINMPYVTGYSAFALFAYRYAGLDNMGDPQIRLADKTITKAPNVAAPGDMVYKGTYQPVWSGGLTNTFTYKNFRLTANVIYNLGHMMRRDVGAFYSNNTLYAGPIYFNNVFGKSDYSGFTSGQIDPIFLQRWQNPGDENKTNVPSYVANAAVAQGRRNANYWNYADLNVLSASYVKLRDITLAYSLPKKLLTGLKTDNITFRVQVSNIMLWKANKYGIDPEFQDASLGRRVPYAPALAGLGVNTTPYMYGQGTVSVGVHVNF